MTKNENIRAKGFKNRKIKIIIMIIIKKKKKKLIKIIIIK